MSGTSAFLRQNCWAKSDSKTLVSTPSNEKFCVVESLIRGQDKIFATKESALGNWQAAFFPFKRIKLVRGILFSLILWKLLLCNCLSIQTVIVVAHRSRDENKLLHIETNGEWGETFSLLWVVTLFRMPEPLFFWFWVINSRESTWTSFQNFLWWYLFIALQTSFEKIYYTFAEEPVKLFWARLKENVFAFVGKWLEHLEKREIFCGHRPKILTISVVPGYEALREWIRVFTIA